MEEFCGNSGTVLLDTHACVQDDDDGSAVTKIGLWGGPGGSAQDITTTEAPRRLNSVTIRAGIAVDSIEFTYTGKDRQRRTAGRWGGLGGNVRTVSE